MARIVLASGSPRRQELLTRIGIRDFTVRVPQVEEWYPQGLTPPEIAGGRREMAQATVYQKHRSMLNRKMTYMG